MDAQAAITALMRERPELVPSLRAIAQLGQTNRELTNALLQQILAMQADLDHKRALAKKMMVLRTGLCPVSSDDPGKRYSLRHIPDVMLRLLCQIAEVPHYTSASPEWLDKMQAREEARPNTGNYEEVL